MKNISSLSHTLMALTVLSISFLAAYNSQAVEPKNPNSLCERFATESDKTQCEQKMQKEAPDWYLAGICSKQFDDHAFYECLNLGKTAKFSPEKIQNCDNTTASDEARLNCLREVAQVGSKSDIYQGGSRKPAEDERWKHNGYSPSRFAK